MALCASAGLLLAGARLEAGPFDPQLRFRVLTTAHFAIYFHQGEEHLAARLAAEAEDVHASLAGVMGRTAGGRTHVVLVDQSDISNASASILPLNTIVVHAAPPPGVSFLGNTSDWLRDAFTHEYAHILHLDRSRGWAAAARAMFGRSLIAFPNLALPFWQIEGIATLMESREGAGRLHAPDFTALVDRAAVERRFEPLDRVSGGLIDWPGPQGWYAYGGLFHQFLAERYGIDAIRRLADRTAGRPPYLSSRAFTREFGQSLGELWHRFERARRDAHTVPTGPAGGRLTRIGFAVDAPRLAPDGSVYFTSSTPHGLPTVRRVAGDGRRSERVLERFGGTGLAITADLIVFEQLEVVRNAGLVSDLYAYERGTGRVHRLTREARLVEPDVSPDGRRLAAVQIVPGGRQLLILDAGRLLDQPSPVRADRLPVIARAGLDGVVFASPRWSPDGGSLAVERGPTPSAIVVLDRDGRERSALAVADGRHVTPAWAPDGRLLFAAERARGFQLYAAAADPQTGDWALHQLTDAPGGRRDPLMLEDGTLLAVGYGTSGFDLYRFRPDELLSSPVARVDSSRGPARRPATSALSPGESYRPWSTLAPRGWLPTVERRDGRWRLGGSTYGVDVLGRHAVAGTATWAVSGADASGLLSPARPDWTASYVYSRWRPSLSVSVSDRSALFHVFRTGGNAAPVVQREQQADVGVLVPILRATRSFAVRGMFHQERVTVQTPGEAARATRAGLRASWTAATARRYGYSISPEDGMALAVTGEWFRPALGSDGRADAVTGDWRGFISPGRSHLVLAVRAAGAASFGDDRTRRRFRLGGADGNASLGGFDSDSVSLLRGFQEGAFDGTRLALVNVEARVPLWRPQRGLGTWPLFLRTLHAAPFVDIGHVWTHEPRWTERKVGAGVELSADVIAGFGAPLTWTAGVAWGHDGARLAPDGREVYVRLGRSF